MEIAAGLSGAASKIFKGLIHQKNSAGILDGKQQQKQQFIRNGQMKSLPKALASCKLSTTPPSDCFVA